MIPSKWRGYAYVGNIVLAGVAIGLAIGVVFFDVATEAEVVAVLVLGASFYSAFVSALARMNLKPDEPFQD